MQLLNLKICFKICGELLEKIPEVFHVVNSMEFIQGLCKSFAEWVNLLFYEYTPAKSKFAEGDVDRSGVKKKMSITKSSHNLLSNIYIQF